MSHCERDRTSIFEKPPRVRARGYISVRATRCSVLTHTYREKSTCSRRYHTYWLACRRIAAASSSLEPSYSHACLRGLDVLPGLTLRDMLSYDQIGREGKLSSRKTTHFRELERESGVPFELGIIRNHYVGRTFIQPGDSIRHMGVKLKHNANRKMIEGKRVVLVDDSIVRGTTSQKIVQMVRDAGAKEVHMRIASPPTRASCFYGVDTPEKSKLLASRMSIREMADFIRVDSLGFLSIDGLYRAVGEANRDAEQPQFCDACFTGEYPTRLLDLEGTDNVRTLSLLATGGQ